jgi:hypothetical protein
MTALATYYDARGCGDPEGGARHLLAKYRPTLFDGFAAVRQAQQPSGGKPWVIKGDLAPGFSRLPGRE